MMRPAILIIGPLCEVPTDLSLLSQCLPPVTQFLSDLLGVQFRVLLLHLLPLGLAEGQVGRHGRFWH